MRRLSFLLLFLAPSLLLAGSYTITTTAAQDTKLERTRVDANANVCTALGLTAGCTQAQACTRAGISSSCTTAQARQARVHLPATIQEFLETAIFYAVLDVLAKEAQEDSVAACTAFKALSQASKDSVCSSLGRPAGCTICP